MAFIKDFDTLSQTFERLNQRQRPSQIYRESLRSNRRLRRVSRQSPLGRAGVNTASVLGGALVDELFKGGFNFDTVFNPSSGSVNTASVLGDIFDHRSVQYGLANIFGDLLQGLATQAFTRTSRRTTVSETERSVDASQRWNISRSQYDAKLASVVQRGLNQL